MTGFGEEHAAVMTWWAALVGVALFNVAAWSGAAVLLGKRLPALPPDVARTRAWVLALGGVYVAGCAFRSFLPMIDAARICLHETGLSRIVIGRSVATIAELCFVAQFALLIREAGRATGQPVTRFVGRWLVPLTVAAEISSWWAVLTTQNVFHAIENSLWTLGAAAVMAAFASAWLHVDARSRRLIVAVLVCGASYVAFMATIDVPMYVGRWQAEALAGSNALTLAAGLGEVAALCNVVRTWAVWRDEIAWLSLYFSVAVWISIALAHAPAFTLEPASGSPRPGRAHTWSRAH